VTLYLENSATFNLLNLHPALEISARCELSSPMLNGLFAVCLCVCVFFFCLSVGHGRELYKNDSTDRGAVWCLVAELESAQGTMYWVGARIPHPREAALSAVNMNGHALACP